MCYACIFNPYDVIDLAQQTAQQRFKARRERLQHEAELIKEARKVIDEETGGALCGTGNDVVESLKERQYQIAREL
jgi:hypothetical protein